MKLKIDLNTCGIFSLWFLIVAVNIDVVFRSIILSWSCLCFVLFIFKDVIHMFLGDDEEHKNNNRRNNNTKEAKRLN